VYIFGLFSLKEAKMKIESILTFEKGDLDAYHVFSICDSGKDTMGVLLICKPKPNITFYFSTSSPFYLFMGTNVGTVRYPPRNVECFCYIAEALLKKIQEFYHPAEKFLQGIPKQPVEKSPLPHGTIKPKKKCPISKFMQEYGSYRIMYNPNNDKYWCRLIVSGDWYTISRNTISEVKYEIDHCRK
jgi:hypothetical protein